MTEPLSYNIIPCKLNPLRITILKATNPNRTALGKKETKEERDTRKELETRSTPAENLRRLFRKLFLAKWQVTNLYPWFEEFAPGYTVEASSGEGVIVTFANADHLMLFKLTWV